MTDKFMSGWGRAEGKINKYVIGVNSYEEAQTIKKKARSRPEMKYINIRNRKPYYNKRRFFVSRKNWEDLGDCWKV